MSTTTSDAMRTLILQFTTQELAVVQELAEYHQLSELQTMRQALRFYQLHDKRVRDGETVKWSGDDARAREFAALSLAVPPADSHADLVRALEESREALEGWLAFAEEELGEFDLEECDVTGEEGLCAKCESSGCINLKIRNTRKALATLTARRVG